MKPFLLSDPRARLARVAVGIERDALIARGMFTHVYGVEQGVVKITVDPANYLFLTHERRPLGIHFPTVLENYGQVAPGVWGVRVERLEKIPRGGPMRRAARDLKTSVTSAKINAGGWPKRSDTELFEAKVLRMVHPDGLLPESLVLALWSLGEFIGEFAAGVRLDLHPQNFMVRPAQSPILVINDPICGS